MESISIEDTPNPPHLSIIDHEIWTSCCFRIHRGVAIFLAQLMICITVLVFCLVQLTRDITGEERAFYFSTISFFLGLFMPGQDAEV